MTEENPVEKPIEWGIAMTADALWLYADDYGCSSHNSGSVSSSLLVPGSFLHTQVSEGNVW